MSEKEPTEGSPVEPEPTQETAAEPVPPEPAPEPPEPEPEPGPAAEAWTVVTPPAPARRLYRSREDRVVAGVCGGLGEYFGVDAVLIRIAALVLVFAGGAGLLLYVVGWIAMPEAPEAGDEAASAAATPRREPRGGAVALGLLFILLGALFLVDEAWSDFLAWKYIWPIALIVIGAAVLVRARQ